MKKNIVLLAAFFAAMTAFTSCDDVTDCGCECSQPIVNRVELLDSAGVDYTNKSIPAGSAIVVMGENLGDVVAVKFGDKSADLKPAYRTDNTLVFVVPNVTKSCQGTLITSSCPNGYVQDHLSIVLGAPTAYMFYNEFVPDDSILKVKGSSFVGDQLEVDFIADNGTDTLKVSGSDLSVKDAEGTELWVKVPKGVGCSHPVIFKNNAEPASRNKSVSKILFRDTTNMLINFDSNVGFLLNSGNVGKDAAGHYNPVDSISPAGVTYGSLVPENYHRGNTKNAYGIFYQNDDWKAIQYAPKNQSLVFGKYTDDALKNPKNYAVKFEVYVPEAYSMEGVTFALGFTSDREKDMTPPRKYSAELNFSPISWNKPAGAAWTVAKAGSFYTSGWMTVTVPLDEFIWNIALKTYITDAQNLAGNKYADITDASDLYGDGLNDGNPYSHQNYVSYIQTKGIGAEDLFMYLGGFSIVCGSSDQPATDGSFIFAIDNVRIVPQDGNGAVYRKLDWGKPYQHYIDAPLTRSFSNPL
jgi:hypothetical protein